VSRVKSVALGRTSSAGLLGPLQKGVEETTHRRTLQIVWWQRDRL
jgi:hypothetical protein